MPSDRERERYMHALQKLVYYLNRAIFTIKTDHKLEAEWANKKVQQCVLKLSRYNCKGEYLARKENTCANLCG